MGRANLCFQEAVKGKQVIFSNLLDGLPFEWIFVYIIPGEFARNK